MSNFETVTIILEGLGAVYNPGQPSIALAALMSKAAEAKGSINAVNEAQAVKTLKVDELQEAFSDLDRYVVDIKRTAEVELDDEALNHDLQNIVNRMHPRARAKPAKAEAGGGEPAAKAHSMSQRSYDDLIAHLADIHALLRERSDYKPPAEDAEFGTEAIAARIAMLTGKNNAVKTAVAALGNAQDVRNRTLYDPRTGVLKLVRLVKTHIARKTGRTSIAYQQITALEFRKR